MMAVVLKVLKLLKVTITHIRDLRWVSGCRWLGLVQKNELVDRAYSICLCVSASQTNTFKKCFNIFWNTNEESMKDYRKQKTLFFDFSFKIIAMIWFALL